MVMGIKISARLNLGSVLLVVHRYTRHCNIYILTTTFSVILIATLNMSALFLSAIAHAFSKSVHSLSHSDHCTKMHKSSCIPTLYVQLSTIQYFQYIVVCIPKSTSLFKLYPLAVNPIPTFQVSICILPPPYNKATSQA